MQHPATGGPETGGKPQVLSRRAVLLLAAAGVIPTGSATPQRAGRPPTDDVVVIDGWILRVDDLEGMLRRVG